MKTNLRFLTVLGPWAVLCVCWLGSAEIATPQEGAYDETGAYVSQKARFSMNLPRGFKAWPEERVKEIYGSKAYPTVPEDNRAEFEEWRSRIVRCVFEPDAPNISNQSLMIIYGHPQHNSLDEFANFYAASREDSVIHSKKTEIVDNRTAFILDWEIDREGVRFRQLLSFVPGVGPMGYLLTYTSVGVEFDRYQEEYLKSLVSFKMLPPPEVPPELIQNRYANRGKDKADATPAWRSFEVIASVVVLGVVILWFVLRALMKGAATEKAGATLPGGSPPPSDDKPDPGAEQK